MDREDFLERCREIEEGVGLAELADDLYASLKRGAEGPERDELVKRAKEKIRLWDALWADLEKLPEKARESRQEEVQSINRLIKRLHRYFQKLNPES